VHLHHEARLEPRGHPLLQGADLHGRAVGGQDDLLSLLHQRVEGVEELLLRGVLAGDELDVVHHEDVHARKACLKSIIGGRAARSRSGS
jgi:hypothetical protein